MRVAAAQMKVEDDILANLKKMRGFIRSAEKVDILCFPETCLNSEEERIVDVSEEIKELQAEVRDKKLWCIFGTYIPFEDKLKNRIYVLDRDGEIVYTYDKIHLWQTEKGKVIPGDSNQVIETEFGKIAVINCWDYAFPEYVKKLSGKGARLIFCPSYLVDYHKAEVLRKLPLVRAFENLAFYISCDAFSEDSFSESYICHPMKTLAEIRKREGMIYADIELSEIDNLRKFYDHVR